MAVELLSALKEGFLYSHAESFGAQAIVRRRNVLGGNLTDNLQEISKKLIEEMRDSFARNDWDQMTRTYEQILELKINRAIRLEATCLSVRALVAGKQRPAARNLLNSVANNSYKKPVHYEFLARAHLDLKQYKAAAEACQQAEELRITETNGQAPTSTPAPAATQFARAGS